MNLEDLSGSIPLQVYITLKIYFNIVCVCGHVRSRACMCQRKFSYQWGLDTETPNNCSYRQL